MQRDVGGTIRLERRAVISGKVPGRLSQYWFVAVLTTLSVLVIVPWLAPAFMRMGWAEAGRAIYTIYSFLCHQLPQRSFFLLGERLTYSLPQIQSAWQATSDPMLLRQFIGTPEMGYMVASSDRMVALYTSIPLAALIWWPLRERLRALPLRGFALLTLPILIDGASHMVSDLSGIEAGFRATNAWLAALTSSALPAAFYAGDAWGSFNSTMRLITGGLFGVGLVWTTFPRIHIELKSLP
jgi:hypothetical protein